MLHTKPAPSKEAAVIDGASIDIIAMPGAVALRLREAPAEPIYVFPLALAQDFHRQFGEMILAAALLGSAGPAQ